MTPNGQETRDRQPRQLKAIDAVIEFTKHQTTFAAILVGLSITLNKDLIPATAGQSLKYLSCSWYVLLMSITSGFITLGAIVSHLRRDDKEELDPYTLLIRLPIIFQIAFLAIGIALLIAAVSPHMGQ